MNGLVHYRGLEPAFLVPRPFDCFVWGSAIFKYGLYQTPNFSGYLGLLVH